MRQIPLRVRVLGSPLQLHKQRVLLPGSTMLASSWLSPVTQHKSATSSSSRAITAGVSSSNEASLRAIGNGTGDLVGTGGGLGGNCSVVEGLLSLPASCGPLQVVGDIGRNLGVGDIRPRGVTGNPWGCCKLPLDFGELAAGEQLEREFYVTNTGRCRVYCTLPAHVVSPKVCKRGSMPLSGNMAPTSDVFLH